MAGEAQGSGGVSVLEFGETLGSANGNSRAIRSWWHKIQSGPLAFMEYRSAAIGMWVVVFWIVVACLAPLLAPYPPNDTAGAISAAPSLQHWMGTDHLGRDVLSRLIYGSRPILLLAPLSVICATIVGITLGLVAAQKPIVPQRPRVLLLRHPHQLGGLALEALQLPFANRHPCADCQFAHGCSPYL